MFPRKLGVAILALDGPQRRKNLNLKETGDKQKTGSSMERSAGLNKLLSPVLQEGYKRKKV